MKKIITSFTVLLTTLTFAQNVGVNSTGTAPNASAILDVDAAPANNKGMLIPRIPLTDIATQAPVTGTAPTSLIVYNTNTTTINGNGEGYYYWSGSKWISIPAPSNGPGISGQVLVSNGNAAPTWQTPGGGAPIGSIIAWHKSFPNTPALPSGWAECNGQTLVDIFSPYNGQVIPNLNSNTQDGSINSGMFLRGASTSGTKQADGTAPNGLSGSVYGLMSANNVSSAGGGWWNGNPAAPVTFSSTDSETRPANMTVVWIMRVE
jgi:hypothetical protein